MCNPRVLSLPILVTAGLLLAHSPALALEGEWDQKRAAELAESLSKQVKSLIQTAKIEERAAGLSPVSADNYLFLQDMVQLQRYAHVLYKHLDKGASRDDTLSLFRRIRQILLQAQEDRRFSSLLTGAEHEMGKARETLEDLAELYGETIESPTTPPVSGGEDAD